MTTPKIASITDIPVSQADPTKTAWGGSLASQYFFVLANGTADPETFDAAADVQPATQTLMAAYGRGVSVVTGGGGDTVAGSAYGDAFQTGDGVNYVDGGANGGVAPDGGQARDVLNVFAASAAAVDALSVTAIDAGATGADGDAYAAGYRVKVGNGAETDYLKNVEQVNVFLAGTHAFVKTIQLTVSVTEIPAGPDDATLDQYLDFAWAQGTDGDDRFDPSLVSQATRDAMDQHGRGVYVDLGAGNDTVMGSAYGDNISVGSGTNYVDGGANGGTPPWGGKAQDVLQIRVASAAEVDAVQVTQLSASSTGADRQAFDQGYTQKVVAGNETDYIRNVERISVWAADGNGNWLGGRDIPLAVTVYEANLSDPASAGSNLLAWAYGTDGADTIDAGSGSGLLSAGIRNAMASGHKGVYIDGGAGDDTVTGSAYDDVIANGAGNAKIDGGAGGRDVFQVAVASAAALDSVQVAASDDPAYQWMVTYGAGSDQKDYLKDVEAISVYALDGSGGKWIPLAVQVVEADLNDNTTAGYGQLAWAYGTAHADTIDAGSGSGLLSSAIQAAMQAARKGVYIDGGAGDDAVTGSAYDDVIVNGAGNAKVDGGAGGRDVFQVAVASSAAVDAVQVTVSDDPAYQWMVTYGAGSNQKDYLKNVEAISVYTVDGSSGKWIPLAVQVDEIDAGADLDTSPQYAWVRGTDGGDSFDPSLISQATRDKMAQHERGVYIDLGAGNDTITGSAYGDYIRNGPGNAKIDGGANAGGNDVFEIEVGSVAALADVKVAASDDPAYTWMVTYGAGSGQKDYLKNIEAVSVYVTGGGAGKWIPLALQVNDFTSLPPADLANTPFYVDIHGTEAAETFDAASLPAGTRAVLDRDGRGVSFDMGDGDDTVAGSGYADTFVAGRGTNYVDGRANAGQMPWSASAVDVLVVNVDSRDAAGAVQVVSLDASSTGLDKQAFERGYTHKVAAGAETDYIKGIERIDIEIPHAGAAPDYVRGVVLAPLANWQTLDNPDIPAYAAQVQVQGTDGNDTIDGAALDALLPEAVRAKMAALSVGAYVDGGAGDDTLAGTAFSDNFAGGAGVNRIDGGANTGVMGTGGLGRDALQVTVASKEQVNAVQALALTAQMTGADHDAYAAGYQWKIVAGAETDYVKNVEDVFVTIQDPVTGNYQFGREIVLALVVDTVALSPTDPDKDIWGAPLSNYGTLAQARAGSGNDSFDAAALLPSATLAAMARLGMGVYADLGGGDDTIKGSDWNDTFVGGSGTNRIDGGAGFDIENIYVASQQAADALAVTELTAGMQGADGTAYAAGYRVKVVDGSVSTDYLKSVEQIDVQVWNDKNGNGARDWGDGSPSDPANEVAWVKSIGIGANTAPTFRGTPDGVAAYDAALATTFQSGTLLAGGQLVAAGRGISGIGTETMSVTRLNGDGSIDGSFAYAGHATLPGAQGVVLAPLELPDHKLLFVETVGNIVQVVRLEADGSYDLAFGNAGVVTLGDAGARTSAYSVLRTPEGKIVIAGGVSAIGSTDADFAVVRLNADGSLDTSFGTGGQARIALSGGLDVARGAALAPDGKLLLAGPAQNGASRDAGIVRLNTDGTLDTSFGTGGKVLLPFAHGQGAVDGVDTANTVQVVAGGKILVTGFATTTASGSSQTDPMLLRLNADGSLDTGFGTGGAVRGPSGGGWDYLYKTIVLDDGSILALGRQDGAAASSQPGNIVVTHFHADGTLDTAFGNNGTATIAARGIGTDTGTFTVANGKITVFGWVYDNAAGTTSALAARLNLDGTPDTSFSAPGATSLGTTVTGDGRHVVALDPHAAIHDAELAGGGNYGGASLTIARTGHADASDLFAGVGDVSLDGGNLTVGGAIIGSVANGGGTLSVTFNGAATEALVQRALQGIGYANVAAGAPPSLVELQWTFSDGNAGGQGIGGALAAHGSTTVLIGTVVDAVAESTANPGHATTGGELAGMAYMANVDGTAGADAFDGAVQFDVATQALMASQARGATFDMGGGGDTVAGTPYVDGFVTGAGVNYVDGGANAVRAGEVAGGDWLQVDVDDAAQGAAVRIVRLDGSGTGADAQAFAKGYEFKIVNGAEIDYIRNIENISIVQSPDATWLKGTSIGKTVDEILPGDTPDTAADGTPLSQFSNFAWVYGTYRDVVFDPAADLLPATRALMAQHQVGVWVETGSGNDTITGTAWGDTISVGAGVNRVDGGANGGTRWGAAEGARDTLIAWVTSDAAAAAVRLTRLDASSTGADGAAYAQGYTAKVVNGAETDYLKNIESVQVMKYTDTDGNGEHSSNEQSDWVREMAAGAYADERTAGDASAADRDFAWIYGGPGDNTIDVAGMLSANVRGLMDQYQRGAYVQTAAGNDTVTGSSYGDSIDVGAGVNYVDGGANAGIGNDGRPAVDALEVAVRSLQEGAAVQAVQLTDGLTGADGAAYDAGYRWKVLAGAETDYLKNVESVRVILWNDANGDGYLDAGKETQWLREIPLQQRIDEAVADPAHPDQALDGQKFADRWHFAYAQGTSGNDDFDVARDVSAASRALMDQYGRGMFFDTGDGHDHVVGGAHGDNARLGAGVNRFDGGDNIGAGPDGSPSVDVLEVEVHTQAEADAVTAIRLDAGMTGLDGAAYANGYRYKVTSGSAETDYLVNVEQVYVQVWTDKDGDGVRDYADAGDPANEVRFDHGITLADIPYANGIVVHEVARAASDPQKSSGGHALASVDALATVTGTGGADTIDASALLSGDVQALMRQYGRFAHFDLGGGDDHVLGTGYSDLFVAGPGTSWIDGGASDGPAPDGSPWGGYDMLTVHVADKAAAQALHADALLPTSTGEDAAAYAGGYEFKVVNGGETDYIRRVEVLDGVYGDGSDPAYVTFMAGMSWIDPDPANPSQDTYGIPMASHDWLALVIGVDGNDHINVWTRIADTTRAGMAATGIGAFVNGGSGDDAIVATPFADHIVGGTGINWIDAGDGLPGANGAADTFEVYVGSVAARDAVSYQVLTAQATGTDRLAYDLGYRIRVDAGAGAETDYLKGVEKLQVGVWTDKDGDGRYTNIASEISDVVHLDVDPNASGVIIVGTAPHA